MTHEARLAAALLAAAGEWERAMGREVFRSFLDFLMHKAKERNRHAKRTQSQRYPFTQTLRTAG